VDSIIGIFWRVKPVTTGTIEGHCPCASIPPLPCRSLIDDEIKSAYSAVSDGAEAGDI
jgi:hypothetical protein